MSKAPSLDEIAAIARQALETLPPPFRDLARDVSVRVEEFATAEVLDSLGIEDAFELTGLYQGVDLARRSVFDSGREPSMVFLYRRAILDEWVERGDVTLTDLVTHVLVHEIGHHFGLSDDDIDRVEETP